MDSNQKSVKLPVLIGGLLLLSGILWLGFKFSWNTAKEGTGNDRGRPKAHAATVRDKVASTNLDNSDKRTTQQTREGVDWTEIPLSMTDLIMLESAPMTPELAEALLARVKSEKKNIEERANLSGFILTFLCKKGYASEAWTMLEDGPGIVRNAQILALFRGDTGKLDPLLSRLEALNDPEERAMAIGSIAQSRLLELKETNFDQISVTTDRERRAIQTGILFALVESKGNGDAGKSEELVRAALELSKTGKIDANNISIILRGTFSGEPFKKWEILEDAGAGLPPAAAERVLSETVPEMVTSDMTKAMQILTTSNASKYSVPILSSAISTMYKNAPDQANEWVLKNLASIDPATGQRVIFRVAQVAIKNGEIDTAKQWSDRLLNPGVKQQLLDQIKAAQPAQAK